MKIDCYSEPEIRDIIYKELSKRDKILSKTQLKNFIKHEVKEQLKLIYGDLFNTRKEIRRLKEDIKIINNKLIVRR